MDESPIPNTEPKISFSVYLAGGAFLIAGLSTVFAYNAKRAADRHEDVIGKQTSGNASIDKNLIAQLQSEVTALRSDNAALRETAQTLGGRIAELRAATAKGFNDVEAAFVKLRARPIQDHNAAGGSGHSQRQQPGIHNVAASGEHVIRAGDNPVTLAKHYGVTARAILDANPGLEPTRLQIGQKIKIPSRPATPSRAPEPPPGRTGTTTLGTSTSTPIPPR
jgi:phage tail protein X